MFESLKFFFTYCPFNISRKEYLLLGILFEMKTFCSNWPYLIRNHLSFLCLCFVLQKFTIKLNLGPKIGLTYAVSIVKRFLYKKIFFTFLCWIWITYVSQHYCENFEQINKQNLLKNCLRYLPQRFLHNLHWFLLWRKVEILNLKKKKKISRIKLFVHK